MINSIEDFKNQYEKACVVNYDMADIRPFGCGLAYRTFTDSVEKFRIDHGKYLKYPYIQEYSKLNGENYNVFIIKDNKIFELEKGSEEHTFVIKKERNDINLMIFDKFFYKEEKNIKKSRNSKDEPIYIIKEKN